MIKTKIVSLTIVLLLVLGMVGVTKAQDKVELVYWSMWNQTEPQALAIQDWINDFQTANPNITIKAVWNGRQNQTLVRTALSAGTVIDFMDQDADQVAGGLVLEGMGAPLNDILNQPALDTQAPVKDSFLPGTLDLLQGQTKYMWPYIYNTVQFFYDKRVFADAKADVPQTWDDLLKVNDALKAAKYAPIASESDSPGYQIFFYTYLTARLEGPGKVLAASEDKTGEMWRQPVYLNAAKMVSDLWTRGDFPPETKGYVWPQGQQTLAAGKSAMELCGSWLPTELSSAVDKDFQWAGFAFPAIKDGKGSPKTLQALLLSFVIMKDSKHQKEVGNFLNFTMTTKNQQHMVEKGVVGVTRKGVAWPALLADAAKAAADADQLFGDHDGVSALHAEYQNKVLDPNYKDMFLGKTTPEQFVDKMANDTKAYWATKK